MPRSRNPNKNSENLSASKHFFEAQYYTLVDWPLSYRLHVKRKLLVNHPTLSKKKDFRPAFEPI